MRPVICWAHPPRGDRHASGCTTHDSCAAPSRLGLALMFVGLLVFFGAYFALPFVLVNGVFSCGDVCTSPKSFSMWDLSLQHLSNFRFAPIGYTLALAVVFLPLLGVSSGRGV